jgi:predicted protein tyrosine phosphatase
MKTLLFISLFISVASCKYIVKGAKNILEGKKVYDNTVTKNKKTQINFPNNYKYKKSDIILLNKKMRKRLQDVDQKITLNELYFSAAVERKFIKYLNISKKNSFLNLKRINLISAKLDKDKNNPFTREEMEYLKISKLLKLKQLKDKK